MASSASIAGLRGEISPDPADPFGGTVLIALGATTHTPASDLSTLAGGASGAPTQPCALARARLLRLVAVRRNRSAWNPIRSTYGIPMAGLAFSSAAMRRRSSIMSAPLNFSKRTLLHCALRQ